MITKASPLLTSLSEARRTQALERFALLRPALEGQLSQTQLARDQQIPLSTIRRWIKQYREKGVPRGRGKIERFFRSVNELFLQDLPGYCPGGVSNRGTPLAFRL